MSKILASTYPPMRELLALSNDMHPLIVRAGRLLAGEPSPQEAMDANKAIILDRAASRAIHALLDAREMILVAIRECERE